MDKNVENDFNEIIKDEMKEKIIFENEYDEIRLNGEILEPQKLEVYNKYSIPVGALFLILGVIAWIVFDEFWWFIVGIAIATATGITIKSNRKNK